MQRGEVRVEGREQPRLFLAVWPPDAVVATLEGLHRKDARGVRFVPPDNWHVTLRFLGGCAPGSVVAALDGVALPSTRLHMGPAVDLLHRRMLVVPVTGAEDLAAVVTRATRDVGEPAPRRAFFGHITVARGRQNATMPRTLGERVSADWEADEVALVQSRLHPDGARYETLHTWSVRSQ